MHVLKLWEFKKGYAVLSGNIREVFFEGENICIGP